MKQFALHTRIQQFDTFDEFVDAFACGEDDLVITHAFLHDAFMQNVSIHTAFLFQEQFGSGEPNDEMIDQMLAQVPPSSYRRVIAVGGGTVIDIAKIFALKRAPRAASLFDKTAPAVKEKALVIIPTTCGTGSEVTNITIAELRSKQTKMGLADDALYADDAVLIPELVRGLPYPFFVFSSIDALIHAAESMVSPKSNSYTELFARRAIEIILGGYARIIESGPEARYEMIEGFLTASNYAGIAFGNTGVGAVHAMSYPLGAKYHVAHGESNALFFTAVMQAYQQAEPNGKTGELAKLLRSLLHVEDESNVFAALEKMLGSVIETKRLRKYGMTYPEIETFAESVIEKQQRLLVNSAVPMTFEAIRAIYEQLY